MKSQLFLFTVLLCVRLVNAEGLSEGDRKRFSQEIDYVGSILQNDYAPREWKEKHLGWNLPAEILKAQTHLSQAQNLREARAAMAGLISSTSDYHVGFAFYTTEKAVLPFQVKTVEGKTLIVYIDRTQLSKTAFPFEVGDELLMMDQEPVAKTLQDLMSAVGTNIPQTDLARADMYLTRRTMKLNHVVPQGPVILAIKRANGSTGTVHLVWDYSEEQMLPTSSVALDSGAGPKVQSLFVLGDSQYQEFQTDANNYGLGIRSSLLPDFGERIWQTAPDNVFDAYIFATPEGKLIGVVRISGYMTKDYNKAVQDYAQIMRHFQKHTSGLILDQLNNPGGSVFYLYGLASTMTDQTLKVPLHKIALNTPTVKDCIDTGNLLKSVRNDEDAVKVLGDIGGYPVDYQLAVGVRSYCAQMISEYRTGVKLTTPLYLWGVEEINPHATSRYTKPIVMLINELDFSGGDFMPAILQDNKRVTLVGHRTAGAGGYVEQYRVPNGIGLETFTITGSIVERVDKNPIENLGVTPDVEIPVTVQDIRGGYQNYKSEVLKTLQKLL